MADEKITQLIEKITPLNADILPIVDMSGFPTNQKVQYGNLMASLNVKSFGAKGDGIRVKGVSCTISSNFITVPNANFTQDDVGKVCIIFDGENAGNVTTIRDVLSPTTLNLSQIAGITKNDATTWFAYGTDDSAAFAKCFNQASSIITTDPAVAPNRPTGTGQILINVPVVTNNGFYIIANPITIPSGVIFDGQGMLLNAITDRFAPFITIQPFTQIRQLTAECALGSGIVAGNTDADQADIHFGSISIWNVGTGISGGNVYQTALQLIGYLFSIDRLFIKGGTYGLWCNSGSDLTVKHVFAVGCTTGVYLYNTNQAHFSNVFLDTIKTNGFYDGAVIIDHGCSDIYMRIQAFEFVTNANTASPLVSIGKLFTNLNTYIVLDIMANNTGGTILGMDYTQDALINIIGSNKQLPQGANNAILTGVDFGNNCNGMISIHATLSANITPYTGTIFGDYTYSQPGLTTSSNGLAINQTTSGINALTVGLDESSGLKQAMYAFNKTNWAVVTGLILLELVNGSDSGYVLKLKNAGSGDFLVVTDHSDNVLCHIGANGVIYPLQKSSAPTYVKGGLYFNTTQNKLYVGGASAWEQVTSV